jgi:hypothetical protein
MLERCKGRVGALRKEHGLEVCPVSSPRIATVDSGTASRQCFCAPSDFGEGNPLAWRDVVSQHRLARRAASELFA